MEEKWEYFLLKYEFAINSLKTKLDILNTEYSHTYNYNPIEHIKLRIKSLKSIQEKLKKQGFEFTMENAKEHIHDIGGIRIICSFEDDVYYLYETLCKQSDLEVIRIKDYIQNPKPNGYRSFHAIIKQPVFLSDKVEKVVVELQIRTIVMDFWASLEHKLYYKKNINPPIEIISGLKDCASISSILDEKMSSMKEKIKLLNIKNDI